MTAPKLWSETITHLTASVATGADITDDVRHIITSANEASDLYKYIAGDSLLLYLDTVPHGRKTEVKQWYADVTGHSQSALESYLTVCKYWSAKTRFKILERYPNISFSYLKEATSYAKDYGAWSAVVAMRQAQSVQHLKQIFATRRGSSTAPRYKLVAELDNISQWSSIGLDTDTDYLIRVYTRSDDNAQTI